MATTTGSNLQNQMIKSFVFFDLESTGLPSPGNNPRITELCFLALTRDELLTEAEPRVFNKLCLCFNPRKMIPSLSSQITGLHNDALEQLATFKQQASLVVNFLLNLPQPTCLVAHNGNRYDFPLIMAQLKSAGLTVCDSVLCADSWEAFRTFDGLPPVPQFVLDKRKANTKNRSQVSTVSSSSHPHGKQSPELGRDSSPVLERQDLVSVESRSRRSTHSMSPELEGTEVQSKLLNGTIFYSPSPPRKRGYRVCNQGDTIASPNERPAGYGLGSEDLKSEESPKVQLGWADPDAVTPAKKATVMVEPRAPTKKSVAAGFASWDRQELEEVDAVRHKLFDSDEDSPKGDGVIAAGTENGSVLHSGASQVQSVNLKRPEVSADGGNSVEAVEDPIPLSSLTDSEMDLIEAAEEVEKTCLADSSSIDGQAFQRNTQTNEILSVVKGSKTSGTSEIKSQDAVNKTKLTGEEMPQDRREVNVTSPHKYEASQQSKSQFSSAAAKTLPSAAPTEVSYALDKIYYRVFGQAPSVSHAAEDDCVTMLKIVRGSAMNKFPQWCDANACRLSEVQPMY